MDLKSHQALYTVAYRNRHEEQYGIQLQTSNMSHKPKRKRRNHIRQLFFMMRHYLRI